LPSDIKRCRLFCKSLNEFKLIFLVSMSVIFKNLKFETIDYKDSVLNVREYINFTFLILIKLRDFLTT